MTDKDTAHQEIAAIVERFRTTPKTTRDSYNEAQTRHSFILPLFHALGWNIEDAAEVSAEEQISRGFVDFGFYLNGVPAFYLETKRIKEGISKPKHMEQAMNYAYLKGVTWAVLTDFEELAIFNAEWETSDPAKARFLEFRWEEYANGRFDDLWLLSKPAMQTRDMDKVAERYGKKAKKEPVTNVLFKQLTQWRRDLFNEMRAWSAPSLTQNLPEVDNAVQKFIDRLIFIRTAEDRGIEQNRLQAVSRQSKSSELFPNLLKLFREMDGVYNSNLFAPHPLDSMSIHDPDLLKEIIDGLYKVPGGGYAAYNFNAISADVLGAVYEQYLGFRAQDPEGKKALDPHKQQKRKSQGIYYTPQFVVRYIVQSTLGKLLESGADAHSLRILDPACGSGSFLIEAFDVLDRHLARVEPDVLPQARRRRILTENLYGVDLDEQAVEVTRLNLALRAALERGKLPLLTHIQRGNSLIDDKAIAGDAAFVWAERFADVMERGGFDVVLGNPPYVRIQTLPREHAAWFSKTYEAAKGNYDIYLLFVERALKILKTTGKSGFILPSKFFTTDYGIGLREILSKAKSVSRIVDFGHAQVFANATTYTTLLFLEGSASDKFVYLSAQDWMSKQTSVPSVLNETELPTTHIKDYSSKSWTFNSNQAQSLADKLEISSLKLIELPSDISCGSSTGADDVFVLKAIAGSLITRKGENVSVEADCLRIPIYASDFGRYSFHPQSAERIIFPYRIENNRYHLIPEKEFEEKYPKAYSYLKSCREKLEQRKQSGVWYGYSAARNLALHDKAQFLVPLLANKGLYSYFSGQNKNYCLMAGGGFSILTNSTTLHPLYVLGLLNSTLLFWRLANISNVFRGGWVTCTKQYTGQLPIRKIDFDNPDDKARHDRMVQLVERMLTLQTELAAETFKLSDRRHELVEEISRLGSQIDTLVYALYGLTEEEISLVGAG